MPRTATPRAAPACWTVSLRAEPTPACSAGTALIRADVAAGIARPPPMPIRTMAEETMPNPASEESEASVPNPAAMTVRPTAVMGRLPILLPRVAPAPLKTSVATAIGAKAMPVLAGE